MRWLTVPLAGAFLVTLLPVAATPATRWQRLYTASDRSVDMDLSAIRRHGEVVLAWVKFSFAKEQADPNKGPYRSMLQLWAYQCGIGRHALVQYAEFSKAGADGKVVASDARDHLDWSFPEPDTIGEQAMKIACYRAPKTPSPTGASASL